MAYQNVGTPRFYVSTLQWLKSLGKLGSVESAYITNKDVLSLVDINPTTQATFSGAGGGAFAITYVSQAGYYNTLMPYNQNFMMVLGHNFSGPIKVYFRNAWNDDYTRVANGYEVVNYNAGDGSIQYSGFSIGRGSDAHDVTANVLQLILEEYYVGIDYKFGSLLYGTYYDVPTTPTLKLTMTREMDGVRRIRSKGGTDLINHKYTKPAMWGGSAGAWELYSGSTTDHVISRSGRRMWNLSFSHLSGRNIFAPTESLSPEIFDTSNHTDSDYHSENNYSDGDPIWWRGNRFLEHNDFYTQVIHKTLGGTLPFVFQPDSSNNNPDQFAICKLDMKSLEVKQVAKGIYSMKLKIREVW